MFTLQGIWWCVATALGFVGWPLMAFLSFVLGIMMLRPTPQKVLPLLALVVLIAAAPAFGLGGAPSFAGSVVWPLVVCLSFAGGQAVQAHCQRY